MIKRFSHLIVTTFGLGHLPYAPGTFGSLFAVLVGGALITTSEPYGLWMAIGIVSLLSVIFVPLYLKNHPGKKDPSEIVIDEVLGQMIALLACESWVEISLAFVLFRLFDIWKPWPVSWADKMGGTPTKDTVSIILDDVLAGLLALGWIIFLRSFY